MHTQVHIHTHIHAQAHMHSHMRTYKHAATMEGGMCQHADTSFFCVEDSIIHML
jgi:hypothetical protein